MKKDLIALLCFFYCNLIFSQIYTEPLQLKLDSFFNKIKENEPGGYVFVQMGSQLLYYRSFGVTDMNTKEKFDENTFINIGSFSRPIISYAILLLQQEGKLNVEDSILKFIPDFKKQDLGCKIKVRHLMTHTSGLKDLPTQKMDSVHFLNITDKENFELVKYSNTLTFEPGNNYQISEQAFSALTIIIEKASGMPWQDYIHKKIFMPSGMSFAKFSAKPGEQTSGAHAYRKIKGNYVEYDEGEAPKIYTAANGGIWTTVDNLRKFLYALQYCTFINCDNIKLADELLVPFNWYSPHHIPQTYCWYWNEIAGIEQTNLSFLGKIGGFRTDVVRIPESEFIMVIVTNNSTSYRAQVVDALKQFNFVR